MTELTYMRAVCDDLRAGKLKLSSSPAGSSGLRGAVEVSPSTKSQIIDAADTVLRYAEGAVGMGYRYLDPIVDPLPSPVFASSSRLNGSPVSIEAVDDVYIVCADDVSAFDADGSKIGTLLRKEDGGDDGATYLPAQVSVSPDRAKLAVAVPTWHVVDIYPIDISDGSVVIGERTARFGSYRSSGYLDSGGINTPLGVCWIDDLTIVLSSRTKGVHDDGTRHTGTGSIAVLTVSDDGIEYTATLLGNDGTGSFASGEIATPYTLHYDSGVLTVGSSLDEAAEIVVERTDGAWSARITNIYSRPEGMDVARIEPWSVRIIDDEHLGVVSYATGSIAIMSRSTRDIVSIVGTLVWDDRTDARNLPNQFYGPKDFVPVKSDNWGYLVVDSGNHRLVYATPSNRRQVRYLMPDGEILATAPYTVDSDGAVELPVWETPERLLCVYERSE